MRKRIITLLTDFGTKDHYVASMKGAILSINPDCTLIDITHQVSPQNIEEGAFILAGACSSFPKGTIHLSVVDPGVGSPRKPILLVTSHSFFVGPDNGLFTLAIRKDRLKKAVVLKNEKFFSPKVSTTFHGRDIFAPVAGHLSMGVRPEAFGSVVDDWKEIDFRKPEIKDGELRGEVFHIDGFGNVVSNIDEEELLKFSLGHSCVVNVAGKRIHDLKKSYWEGQEGGPIALLGSTGFLEISIREGNAQKILKVEKGDRVTVRINQ